METFSALLAICAGNSPTHKGQWRGTLMFSLIYARGWYLRRHRAHYDVIVMLNNQSCYSGTTGRAKEAEWRQNHCQGGSRAAVVAEWRHSGRHSDRSWSTKGSAISNNLSANLSFYILWHNSIVYNCMSLYLNDYQLLLTRNETKSI